MQKRGCSRGDTCEMGLTLTFEDGGPGPRAKECGQSLEAEEDPSPASTNSKQMVASFLEQHGAEFCQHYE